MNGVVPVYVNNFNLLTPVRAMIEYLRVVPGCDVTVIDNASTYGPLLDWYDRECPCRVVRLRENLGHQAVWDCGVLPGVSEHRRRYGSGFYVVTDPDLDLSGCPTDLLDVLASGYDERPDARKVGLSLEIEDLPSDSPLAADVRAWERRFWHQRVGLRFFDAEVDTTFALYRVETSPCVARRADRPALRSDRPYTARHLPWYISAANVTEEQAYYVKRARVGRWGQALRDAGLGTPQPGCARRFAPADADAFRPGSGELALFDPRWRASDDLVEVMLAALSIYRPASIVETGPGLTSIPLLRYATASGSVSYIGMEESLGHCLGLRRVLERMQLPSARVFHAPIRDGYYWRQRLLHDVPLPAGLVVLDGPADSDARGSDAALRFAERVVGPGSVVIIDDTHRAPEQRVVDWVRHESRGGRRRLFEVADSRFPPRRSTVLLPAGDLDRAAAFRNVIASAPSVREVPVSACPARR